MMYLLDWIFLFLIISSIFFMIFFFNLFYISRKNIVSYSKPKSFPSVSILIPVYNKEKCIKKTIEYVKKLKYPKKFEIIVINDGSTDNSLEILKKIKGIKVFSKKNGGKADALNYGLKKAKGEIIVTIDADTYPSKDALLKSIGFFEDKDVAAVTVSIFVDRPKNIIEKLQSIEYILYILSRKILENLNAIYVTPGPFALYRKKVLKEIGGFDKNNMTEDIEIAWRILRHGYKIKMSVPIKILTSVPETFKQWWHQRIRWNIGGMQTTIKHIDMLFNTKYSGFGCFVIPLFISAYFFTILGLILTVYLILTRLYDILIIFSSSFYGVNLLNILNFDSLLLPNIFIILSIFSIFSSFLWIWLSFHKINLKIKIKDNFFILIIFLTIYIFLTPLNYIHSTIKFLTKSYSW
ncbi:MAG: glycosyltransferase [Candidatus Aenigmatarchaeota archaeon]|nr:glycosyltransferase family 2 protein [Candidatus Aenigmarchaeota archaeon]